MQINRKYKIYRNDFYIEPYGLTEQSRETKQ